MEKLKGKKILITVGLGFIGSNLAHECVKSGAEVTIYDCLDPRSGGNLYNIMGIAESVQVYSHNILDFDQVSLKCSSPTAKKTSPVDASD